MPEMWRLKDALGEAGVFVVACLTGADGMNAGDHHDLVAGRQLHDLAGREQRPGGLLARDHEMPQPRREAMAGIVLHRPHLGGRAERVGHAFGRALVIGGEAHPDVAVVEDGVVRTVGLFDLVERLGDQERLQAVARHEGQGRLEEVQSPQCRELVEHQQQTVAVCLGLEVFGQPASDLVEQQTDQRLGPVDVRRRHDEVERGWSCAADDIGDPPVAAGGDLRHDRIAIEAEEAHRRTQHAGTFIVRFVEQFACGRSNHGMRTGLAEVRRLHHRRQRRLDRARRIGEEVGDAGERLVFLGIENVEDGADQQRMRGLLPVIAPLQRALGIDQDIGDVLDVPDLPFATTNLEQRIVGRRVRIGRIEQQHAAVLRAEAGGELPVLTLDVVNDGRARPGEQRWNDQADALARSGRCEAQHMLRTVMPEVVALEATEYDAIRSKQAGSHDLSGRRPAGRTIGFDIVGLAGAQDRHEDGGGDG